MTTSAAIKAVIWDMGGVILRTVDKTPRARLAEKFGMTRRELEEIIFAGESCDLATVGLISSEEHWDNIRKQLALEEADMPAFRNQFFTGDRQDNELLDFICSLRPAYRTALLSNAWSDIRQAVTRYYNFLDAFDTSIFSAEIRMAKPNREIYQYALDQLGVAADEAIFIDDLAENVEGAHQVGLYAVQFIDPVQALGEVRALLSANHSKWM